MATTENLGFLLAETARTWRNKLDQRLRPLGLSQAKWLVLVRLHHANDVLTQTELSNLVGIEGPSLVRLLDRMEADGWVERRASPTDRRAKTVHSTPKAVETSREIKRIAARLRTELLTDIPEADQELVAQILSRIKSRAEQI